MTRARAAFTDLHASVDPASACFVYEHGWQSWSPAGVYRGDLAQSPRPQKQIWQAMGFRPEAPGAGSRIPGRGPARSGQRRSHLRGLPQPAPGRRRGVDPCPGRRRSPGRLRRRRRRSPARGEPAGGTRRRRRTPRAATGDSAARAAAGRLVLLVHVLEPGDGAGRTRQPRGHRPADLGIEVVQVDDGYQHEIGDWIEPRPGFGDLAGLAARIIDTGRTPGLWTAPFLVGVDSHLAARPSGLARRGGGGGGAPLGAADPRARRDAPGRGGAPGGRLRDTPVARVRLPQDRLHLRGRHGRATSRGRHADRGLSTRPGADSRGRRRRCRDPRLRGAAAAEHRAGRCDADQPRRHAGLAPGPRRHQPAGHAERACRRPGASLDARPAAG